MSYDINIKPEDLIISEELKAQLRSVIADLNQLAVEQEASGIALKQSGDCPKMIACVSRVSKTLRSGDQEAINKMVSEIQFV